MERKRAPFYRKVAFAVGDVFGGGSFNIINFLYPSFLALTVGLSAYWISIVMLVARIFDAVTDPLMGYLSDKTSSRMGKRRIYILLGAPLVLVSFFLLFYPYSFSSTGVRVAAVMASYIFYCAISTLVSIPYQSLSSEVTSDYAERASFNGLRLGCSIFSSILCVAAPGMIVGGFEDAGRGYIAMSLIFGALFMLVLACTALFTREEIVTPPVRERFSLSVFLRPLKLKEFRLFIGMSLCLSVSMSVMSTLFFFYIDFHIMRAATLAGESNTLGMFSAALMFAMQIVALPFYLWLIGKRSKQFTYRFGSLLWVLGGFLILLLEPGGPLLYVYLLAALLGFGISGPGLAPHTMFGDVMDVAQLTFGMRSEGAFSGLVNLVNKTGQATGIAVAMAVLGAAGFVEQAPGAAKVLSQPESAQNALAWMMALTPLLFMGIGTWISTRYTITKEKQQMILAQIAQKKNETNKKGD